MRDITWTSYRTWREWLALMWIVGAVSVLLPALTHAQNSALVVTLHDPAGQGIAGITVIVRAEDGAELARETTGNDGRVSFSGLAGVVRVAVDGQPRGGPRLYQLGDDTRGVRVDLSQAALPLTLNLCAEPDGLVLPDPATMLALEDGGPRIVDASPFPTAAFATPARVPDARPTTVAVAGIEHPVNDTSPQADWVPPVTLLVIVALVAVLRLVQQLRSAR